MIMVSSMIFYDSSQNMTKMFTTGENTTPFGESVSFTEGEAEEEKVCCWLVQEVPL